MIKEERAGDTIIIRFPGTVKALSSTIVGGGLRRVRAALIKHVDDIGPGDDPRALAAEAAREAGYTPEDAAVFLTAADLSTSYASSTGPGVFVAASMGLEPLACPGKAAGAGPATINIVVYVDECLDGAALVELAHLAGAVKASALASMGLSCGGLRAFGTVTDAVMAASKDCSGVTYAGPATPHGGKVAGLLFDLLIGLGRAGESTWLRRVTGLGMEDLIEAVMRVYRASPVPGVGEGRVRAMVEGVLGEELSDPNLWALLIAAAEADAHAAAGTVPGLSREEHAADSPRVVADELLGAAIATYINGWRGLLAYTWVDRAKDRVTPEVAGLPMFTDDAVAALIGGVLSKVLDRLVGGRS